MRLQSGKFVVIGMHLGADTKIQLNYGVLLGDPYSGPRPESSEFQDTERFRVDFADGDFIDAEIDRESRMEDFSNYDDYWNSKSAQRHYSDNDSYEEFDFFKRNPHINKWSDYDNDNNNDRGHDSNWRRHLDGEDGEQVIDLKSIAPVRGHPLGLKPLPSPTSQKSKPSGTPAVKSVSNPPKSSPLLGGDSSVSDSQKASGPTLPDPAQALPASKMTKAASKAAARIRKQEDQIKTLKETLLLTQNMLKSFMPSKDTSGQTAAPTLN